MNIKQLLYNKPKFNPDLESSVLKLRFINTSPTIINTLRRVSMDNIPCYAFHGDAMIFEKNTSIAFNNDYLRLRFSQLPIYNIKCDLFELPDKFWKNVDFSSTDREKHPSEEDIDIYINSKNITGDIINVTTNDITCYMNNEKIKIYDDKYPILIIKLKPNEEIKCHLHAVLGIGEGNSIWASSINSYYEILDKDIIFSIESNGQFNEYEILIKSCKYIIKRIMDIKNTIKDIKEDTLILELENEDHTIGNLITYFLQINDKIEFAGMAKPDLLQKKIVIKIKGTKQLDDLINKTMDNIISYYDNIMSMLEKLSKH